MGLFDSLKEKFLGKDTCCYCGAELPMNFVPFTGTVKLEDGKLCKECGQKVSPWLSVKKKKMTAEEMGQHLDYRKENEEALSSFEATAYVETSGILLAVDEAKGCMIISQSKDYRRANADILPLNRIIGAKYKICENHYVSRRNMPGGKQMIDEAHYNYQFCFRVSVDHEWISLIDFNVELQSSIDLMRTPEIQQAYNDGEAIVSFLTQLGIPVDRSEDVSLPMADILSGDAAARITAEIEAAMAAPPEPEPAPAHEPGPIAQGAAAGVGMSRKPGPDKKPQAPKPAAGGKPQAAKPEAKPAAGGKPASGATKPAAGTKPQTGKSAAPAAKQTTATKAAAASSEKKETQRVSKIGRGQK